MAVVICGVRKGSPAFRAGILPEEKLISFNGNIITDVLDYQFYMTERKLDILLLDRQGRQKRVRVRKGEYDDLGMEFET